MSIKLYIRTCVYNGSRPLVSCLIDPIGLNLLAVRLEEDDSEDERSEVMALPAPGSPSQGMRASVALRRLDIPSLPQMPTTLEPVELPPEPLENNWPLQALGDAQELPDAAGADMQKELMEAIMKRNIS